MFEDFYFASDDGRVFATKRRAVVDEDDAAFVAWKEAGNVAATWARDETGEQTIASLQEALLLHNVWVDPAAYAANLRWRTEEATVDVLIGGKTVPASTRRADRDGYRDTLLAILLGLREDGMTFKFADGVPRQATNSEMMSAIGAAFAHVQTAFETERSVYAAIEAGAVKTIADVDAAFSLPDEAAGSE